MLKQLLILLLFIIILYYATYYYVKLTITVQSFIAFSLNIIIFGLYTKGLYMLYLGLTDPILLQQLSPLNQLRYLLFLIISLIILDYLLQAKEGTLPYISYVVKIKEPFLQIVQGCPKIELVLAIYSGFIIDLFYKYTSFKYFYFCISFITTSAYRLLLLLLFINFCFFKGDFRYILYFMPISFIFWLYSFITYYFNEFLKDNFSYASSLFDITLKDKTNYEKTSPSIITTPKNNINFQLTEIARQEGITEKNAAVFSDKYMILAIINNYFIIYNRYANYFNIFIFCCYLFCWLYISTHFDFITFEELGFFSIFKRFYHNTPTLYSPRKAYWIDEKAMNQLREKSQGKYSPGHPVYGEPNDKGEVVLEGSVTHDKNNNVPGSTPISDTDFKGDPKLQKAIPFDKPIPLPKSHTKEIPNSDKLLETPTVKSKLDSLHDTTQD